MQELQRTSEDAQSQGWSIHADATVRGGWPVAAAIELPGFTLTADPTAFPGGLVWSAGRIRVQLPFAAPKTLHIFAEGQQDLRLTGLPAIPFQAGTMDLEAALDGDPPPMLSIAALRAELPWGPATVGAATVHFPFDTVLLDARDVTVPGGIGRALGPSIDAVHLRAALTRPIPSGASPAAQARAWREAGGRVDASEFSLHWGPLDIAGHAVLALDERLQPQGEGVLAVTGAAAALDALARTGLMPAGMVTAVKAVLALLAAPAPAAPVQLPMQFRDGVLVVARFPLLRLPQLDWGPG